MPQVKNTLDNDQKPALVMMLYGDGGVGKTTTAASAPQPLLADLEGGTKYFKLRGISVPYMAIDKWADMKDFYDEAKKPEYLSVVIDPVGELMDKLMRFMIAMGDSKLVQRDGSPSQAGWGWLITNFRSYVKSIRDLGKNVILIAHVDETPDENRIVKRPRIQTKVWKNIVEMCDVVGYMTTVTKDGETKRIVHVDPESDKFVAKDRSGQLPKICKPDISEIAEVCAGNGKFAWAPKKTAAVEDKKTKADEVAEKAKQSV